MRNVFVALLFLSLALTSVDAMPPRNIKAPDEPSPAPDKAERTALPVAPRRSLFDRIFGPNPTPAPPPAPPPATPTATKHHVRHPVHQVKTEPSAPKTDQAESTKVAPLPVPKGRGAKVRSVGKKTDSAGKIDFSGMDDAAKFKAVKDRAMEDPEMKELKSKADSEVDETEAHKALAAYNRALFRKIREIEPSLGDYSAKVEASMTRRLSAEKGRP